MGNEGFTMREAVGITGLPYKTLDTWDRRKFLKPSVRKGTGSGRWSPRLYSFPDLVALRVAREIREAGVSLQALRLVRERLKSEPGIGDADPLAALRLVVTPGRRAGKPDVAIVRKGDRVESVLEKPGQRAFSIVLELRPLVLEVRARAEKIRQTA